MELLKCYYYIQPKAKAEKINKICESVQKITNFERYQYNYIKQIGHTINHHRKGHKIDILFYDNHKEEIRKELERYFRINDDIICYCITK